MQVDDGRVCLGRSGLTVALFSLFIEGRFSPHGKQLTKNWYGQGESDCLIKTKHCEGRKRC